MDEITLFFDELPIGINGIENQIYKTGKIIKSNIKDKKNILTNI